MVRQPALDGGTGMGGVLVHLVLLHTTPETGYFVVNERSSGNSRSTVKVLASDKGLLAVASHGRR
jgi:hypothetical protein